jgi:hypothetical protein
VDDADVDVDGHASQRLAYVNRCGYRRGWEWERGGRERERERER